MCQDLKLQLQFFIIKFPEGNLQCYYRVIYKPYTLRPTYTQSVNRLDSM